MVLQYSGAARALPALHPAHGKGKVDGRAVAYVCRGQTCSLPLAEPAALQAALREQVFT
jgi:uncharacterized protein YyaL (SSP411 family)